MPVPPTPPTSKVSCSGVLAGWGSMPSPLDTISLVSQPKSGSTHLIFRHRIHGRYGSFLTMMVPS